MCVCALYELINPILVIHQSGCSAMKDQCSAMKYLNDILTNADYNVVMVQQSNPLDLRSTFDRIINDIEGLQT